MSAALTEDDLDGLIRMSISSTDAQGMQDMGHLSRKVRAALAN
ncbi:GatB/Yqey domain-containing protein [Marinobacter lipolyticus SM19]|uniref:GatB/Yqey domain-containing protein n=1 Tax=Marinobacter lipolyticus SM19 TaxID=1318628 RepID=R8B553_9GAMM|nr:GatB/Yqey domain-containing protein [Marinobacter lipolyticus SM19]